MSDDELPDLSFIELDAIEDWTVEGVRCVMRAGYSSLNGYVRLPEKLRDWWANDEEASQALEAHFGLTYGPDGDGWIGFDTAHYTDWWALDDLIGRIPDEGLQLASTFARINAQSFRTRRWTLARLREATEALATQVSAIMRELDSEQPPSWLTENAQRQEPTSPQ